VNCKEAQQLIHGYVDGELDLVRSMEVEGHLEDCGSCLQAIKSQRELKEVIGSGSFRFDVPKGLEKRVLAAARRESKAGATRPGTPWRRLLNTAMPAFGAAVIALIAFMAWGLVHPNTGLRAQDVLAEEVVSSHVRSLMASHLFDVASTDQHTVKPWFANKLDYSPPVVDLADKGFPLTGGRLDYLNGRPVAALVYHRRLHIINLFIWPTASGATETQEEARRGYHIIKWTRQGMAFYAVSDVNASDLKEFSRNLIARAGP
jgi:anti-sigma factor RsiW